MQQSAGDNQILIHALMLTCQRHSNARHINRMLQKAADICVMQTHTGRISYEFVIRIAAENSLQQHTQTRCAHRLDIVGELRLIRLNIKIALRQQVADIVLRHNVIQTLHNNLQRHIISELVDIHSAANHKRHCALQVAQLVDQRCLKADKSHTAAVVLQHTARKNAAVRGIANLLHAHQRCLANLHSGLKIFNHSLLLLLYMLQQ